MRLWSIHPKYLDSKGLVALWREGLLAKHVLEGKTKGYKNHPQLLRFKECVNPINAIHYYLFQVFEEANVRGYCFDDSKIMKVKSIEKIKVNDKQVEYEWKHLKRKLITRDKKKYSEIKNSKTIKIHPLFKLKKGEIELWEIIEKK